MSRPTTLALGTALALGAGLAVLPTQAHAATVVVNTTTALSNAIKNATPGTVIQVRGGTYSPTATLQSTANGTSSSRIYLQPYGSETVKIDGSNLPAGGWIFKLTADYWTVSGITFQNSPDSAVVCQSCASTVWDNIKTINGGDSGFTLTGDGTTNNTVRNIDSYGHYDRANHGENADGIAVKFGSGGGNLITGARLYNNADDGLDFWSFSSPVTVEHTWAMGNGRNRWGDSAFAGDGNGYKLGGDGETVAHVINNSAAWDNAGNGFTENSNKGAIVINRTTAYANAKWGYYFATGAARLGRNLAVGNSGGSVNKGSSVVSSGNNWDAGVPTPAFRSTSASTTFNARSSSGTLPATTFLTTGSTTIGATMD
ncbi:right-handed parallel beta-helix repeat-containing protein [Streptomyces scabiei]|uniref:right-handed parallel beta-helix repeat-containing protein n=1 Tax=Streptomyces scabiei TaxID=1930 RepID=UPI001B3164BE|nr:MULTISPECIES: right-handed parallel beta-helix repeat-containing protein [Streptomyces]MBP5917699.1 pectate lyase [Streptomyces sp. LBUM 1486]MDX2534000.1 right-handed parallel beta-helix repeat-containing protein [Streptomyces scabiei]MDX2795622.1 right-handed parallel beta-helix repeat-containing protein [Streptomyces scabiei]MDX2856234.1 right-handed parallel beta-helix repeat-containing protein [Streptomyces scabiei]MDX3029232.1 right-handed parallel beta-helix repeat-containing protein